MSLDKTIEGVGAIFIILIFLTMVLPALISTSGINLWWIFPSFVLIILGIILGIIKEWG